MIQRHICATFAGLALAASAFLFTGCASHSYDAGAVAPVHNVRPDAFAWEGQAIEAAERAPAPTNINVQFQRSIAARRAAKTAAIANLKGQVGTLPVIDGATLGDLMQNNLGLRHAVENYLQKAQVLSENQVGNEQYEVRVRLPLEPIGDILRQYRITPEGVPDVPPVDETGVAPVT